MPARHVDRPLPAAEPDHAASIFFDRQLRAEGQALVLKLLRRDLSPDDFVVARRLVELLYDNTDRGEVATDGTAATT